MGNVASFGEADLEFEEIGSYSDSESDSAGGAEKNRVCFWKVHTAAFGFYARA
jgi:hypothetical protein